MDTPTDAPQGHKCEICGKKFKTDGWLERHMKLHKIEARENSGSQATRPPVSSGKQPKKKTRVPRKPKHTPAPAPKRKWEGLVPIDRVNELKAQLADRNKEILELQQTLAVQNLRVGNLKSALQAAHTVVSLGLNADVARPQGQ